LRASNSADESVRHILAERGGQEADELAHLWWLCALKISEEQPQRDHSGELPQASSFQDSNGRLAEFASVKLKAEHWRVAVSEYDSSSMSYNES